MWTILIVDDLKFVLEHSGLLAREGLRIVTADCFDGAIRTARAVLPDIVLVDYHLERSRGEELCGVLKDLPELSNPVLIAALVRGIDEHVVETLPSFVNDVFWKPFNAHELGELISEHLGVRRRRGVRVSTLLQCRAGRPGGEFLYARILNISTGGVLLESSESLEVGATYDCHFTLPGDSGLISAAIDVVREVPLRNGDAKYRYGAQFTTASSNDRTSPDAASPDERIASFVRRNVEESRTGRRPTGSPDERPRSD